MMIAAAVCECSFDAIIPPSLDEASGLLIFDVEQSFEETYRYVTDDFSKAIINSHCEAVLCGQIYNKKLFDKIADEGITRYNAAGMPLRQAIDAMNKYQLNYIRDYVGGTGCHEHHHGD